MIIEEFMCTATGHGFFVHDDVLTREVVETYRGCFCMLTVSRGIEFVCIDGGRQETHRYPMVAQERILPLLKLLVQLQIRFASAPPLPDYPQEWLHGAKPKTNRPALLTEEQKRQKREEAKMAAARRVLAYKARQGQIDPNDAFSEADSDREPDVW